MAASWMPTFTSSTWFNYVNFFVSVISLCILALVTILFALTPLWQAWGARCRQCCRDRRRRDPVDEPGDLELANGDDYDGHEKNEKKKNETTLSLSLDNKEQEESEAPPAKPKPARLHYLDNIKWMLIEVVILHHVACALSGYNCIGISIFPATVGMGEPGSNDSLMVLQLISRWFLTLNQSYFMALFFFISAYFSPSSLDRKGAWKFLEDKFWRLGVPLTVCSFLLYPAINTAITNILQPEQRFWVNPPYVPSLDQLWFVFWLLLFNLVYLGCSQIHHAIGKTRGESIEKKNASMSLLRPVLYFLAVWIGVSVVQGCISILGLYHGTASWGMLFNSPSFFDMGMYVTYFVGGILAKRHGWLTAFATLDCKLVWMARACCLVGAFLPGICPLWEGLPSWVAVDARLKETGASTFVVTPGLFYNLFGLAFTVVLLHDAPKYLNFTNPFTRFMARSAYTAYIIHLWFVKLAVISFGFILGATTEIPAVGWLGVGSLAVKAEEVAAWMPWVAALYVSVVVSVVVWPVAYALAVMPGLRTML